MMEYDASLGGIIALIVAMLLLTTITLGLRLAARYKQRLLVGPDDCCAVIAWLLFIGLSATAIYCMTIGFMGFSVPANRALTTEIALAARKALLPAGLLSILALGFTRLSAVFFYRRIFCTTIRDAFNVLTIFFIVLVSLWTAGFFFSSLFACGGNINEYYAPDATTVCFIYANQKGLAGTSFALDLLILLLPLPKILTLHTTANRKAAIAGVFTLALIGVGASCARLVIYVEIEDRGATANTKDPFQANSQSWFYSILEVGMCLTTINLPSNWYFIHDISPAKILRSLRSLVSLRSSTRSSDSIPSTNSFSKDSNSEMSSRSPIPTKRDGVELSKV